MSCRMAAFMLSSRLFCCLRLRSPCWSITAPGAACPACEQLAPQRHLAKVGKQCRVCVEAQGGVWERHITPPPGKGAPECVPDQGRRDGRPMGGDSVDDVTHESASSQRQRARQREVFEEHA